MTKRIVEIEGVETIVELPKELEDLDKLAAFLSGGERFSAEAGHFAKIAAENPILGAERRRRLRLHLAAQKSREI